jgi:branched-chain amino acid transport system substrate-binding protein
MHPAGRWAAALVAATLLAAPAAAVRAADPYEINAILPLTGNIAFVGQTEQQALKALEGYVNQTGGIRGRPLSFVVADDQSDVKTSLQLAQGLIAKNVPVILGPSSPQACAAIAPIIAQSGPVLYCQANAGQATPGGYEFFAAFPYEPQFAVTFRYFRARGLRRIAYIVSTDAGGQDVERAIATTSALPENKDVQIVAREHFSPGDITVAGQMARIKAATPDVLVAWSTGGSGGTLLRGARDAGLDLPTVTSTGNLSANFFKQYQSLFPTNLYFAAVAYYAGDAVGTPASKAAVASLTSALATVGAKPDMISISIWDPALLLVDALRKLGPDVPAEKLREYLAGLRGWVGANGAYDFRAIPQRGLGENNVVMVRYTGTNPGVAVSAFGGAPLPGK